jgi:hypothetical protein
MDFTLADYGGGGEELVSATPLTWGRGRLSPRRGEENESRRVHRVRERGPRSGICGETKSPRFEEPGADFEIENRYGFDRLAIL